MNSTDSAKIRTDLNQLLRRFESCLPSKNCEAIALQTKVPPRSVQWFLAKQQWDHEKMRNKLQKIIAKEHAGKHSIGIIDETSFVKKGIKTPGVQRQYCGTVGKQENCIVTVHLAYAINNFILLNDVERKGIFAGNDFRFQWSLFGIHVDMPGQVHRLSCSLCIGEVITLIRATSYSGSVLVSGMQTNVLPQSSPDINSDSSAKSNSI